MSFSREARQRKIKSMAAISYISVPPIPKTLSLKQIPYISFRFSSSSPLSRTVSSFSRHRVQAAESSSPSIVEEKKLEDELISVEILKRFININLGKWNGLFYVSLKSLLLTFDLFFFPSSAIM